MRRKQIPLSLHTLSPELADQESFLCTTRSEYIWSVFGHLNYFETTISLCTRIQRNKKKHALNGNCQRIHVRSQLHNYELLLKNILNRALSYRKRRIHFDSLYQSIKRKIESGPGYRKRKCSKMKTIYKKFDSELKNILQLCERYQIEMSPLKMEKLFPRLRLLELQFLEKWSELSTLRQRCKRFCHKCPNTNKSQSETFEVICFSVDLDSIMKPCCYSINSNASHFATYVDYEQRFEMSVSENHCMPCVSGELNIPSCCHSIGSKTFKRESLFVKKIMSFNSSTALRGKFKKLFIRRQWKKYASRLESDVLTYKNAYFTATFIMITQILDFSLQVDVQHFNKYEYNVLMEILYQDFDFDHVFSRDSPKKSRKEHNKEMHITNGNTIEKVKSHSSFQEYLRHNNDRIRNESRFYKYHYLQDRRGNFETKDLIETQDTSRLDCLRHALNNMFYVKRKFSNIDLNRTVDQIVHDFEYIPTNSTDYARLKSEHVSPRGNYSVNVGHKLLSDRGFDILNLKYFGNQRGVDYTVFLPSFRGDLNFVGCLLQTGNENYGHYTCIHHDQNSGNLFYMDSCTRSIEIKSESHLKSIIKNQKVWGIFTRQAINFEHAWVDSWYRYVKENKLDDVYQKKLIQYYFVENKEIFQ